ncbi:MAG TPA: 3-dehydroquinate synthase [Lacipirellulaceae bacterium]|jgi:3-dehydroquinate synthase|nr:3-dehydroquinate synthase [Lacipirellulaceae bacterium]
MPTVHVNLGPRSYDIEIGSGNLRDAAKLCDAEQDDAHTIIITDSNVAELYSETVVEALEELGCEVAALEVEPGEPSKAPEVATELWEELLDNGADRKTVVVALGGGVVGDLAGFVAATFGRGLRFVQIPTTLLAQVDSSVGGKVGVNLPGAKNIVGAFWQPRGVLIDVDVLQSLPEREYRAGLAEVVKYGVIQDADFFAYLEANVEQVNARNGEVLMYIVERCCRLKADVVEHDEREETGLRAILNYGHTYCHAFEAATGYETLLHGEGVAIGMMCAARLAERLRRVDAAFVDRQRDLLEAFKMPLDVPDVDHDELVELMYHDKKVERGKLRFVLPTRMGHVELVRDVTNEDVLASMAVD